MKNILTILVILFCSLFVGFGGLAIYQGIRDLNDPNHQVNWQKKTAVITAYENIETVKVDENYPIDYDVIHYKYEHSNSNYTKTDTIHDNSEVEVDKNIYVWLNPNKPDESVLIVSRNAKSLYDQIIFGFGFSILPLFMIGLGLISIFNSDEIAHKIKIIE